ncbi:RNA polymerase sigma factor, partial [bacterium]
EKQKAVRAAIDSLPSNQKTAVLLHRFQGLSYTEIAEVMHCSVSAVESRLFRAKQALQKKLQSLVK